MHFDLSEIIKSVHLPAGCEIPDVIGVGPCSMFICDPHEGAWEKENWRYELCKWIIDSNCRYMVAWGPRSTKWDDGVDEAYLIKNNYICHDENMCMTTWHDKEILETAFEFFINCANVEDEIQRKIIIDISEQPIDFTALSVPQ